MAGVIRTLAQLREDFYDEIQRDGAVIPPAKANRLLNQGGIMLHAFVARRPSQRILYAEQPVTVAQGGELQLPATFRSLIALRYTDRDGKRRDIMPGDFDRLDAIGPRDARMRDWHRSQVRYIFTGNRLAFDPPPEAQYVVAVHYVPTTPFFRNDRVPLTEMTADTDYMELPLQYHRYLVLQAAKMGLERRGESVNHLKEQIAEWTQLVEDDLKTSRQPTRAPAVRDTYGDRVMLESWPWPTRRVL